MVPREIHGIKYYATTHVISWWNAEWACAALAEQLNRPNSLKLLSVSDFVTETDGTTWDGDLGVHQRTDLAYEFLDWLGETVIWTRDINFNDLAFYARLRDGNVGEWNRDDSKYFRAICR